MKLIPPLVYALSLFLLCSCTSASSNSGYSTSESVSSPISSVSSSEENTLEALRQAAGVADDGSADEATADIPYTVQSGVLFYGDNPVDTSTTSLDLMGEDINDWTFLSVFTQLEALRIDASNLSEEALQSLGSLPNLIELSINNYPFKTLNALAGCVGLHSLALSSNTLCDISVISSFQSLTDLSLGFLPELTDGTAISSLSKLERLTLDTVAFEDLNFLTESTSLTYLRLVIAANMTDFSAISRLEQLTELHLTQTPFDDLSVLQNLRNLSVLSFTKTAVSSFAPLAEYDLNLTQLICYGTEAELTLLREAYPDCQIQ